MAAGRACKNDCGNQVTSRHGHTECNRCRVIRRWPAELKRVYGLSGEEYEDMLARQGGVCALCSKPPPNNRIQRLSVDHDHETGRVRGLLCRQCNVALGTLGDSPECLRRAVAYLEG